jgi:membrane protease YdiL (CAAX protease family)
VDFLDEFKRAGVAYAIVAALALVLIAALNWRKRSRLLPMPRLRPTTWNGRMTLAQFLLGEACFLLTYQLLVSLGFFDAVLPADASFARRVFITTPLTMVLYFAVSATILYAVDGTTMPQVGLGMFRWRANVTLGAIAFMTATPFVLGFYWVLLQFNAESPNPLVRIVRQGIEPYEWVFILVNTVVLAPIWEEWLYRGILQGWLRRTNLIGHAVLIGCLMFNVVFVTLAPLVQSSTPDAERVAPDEKQGEPAPTGRVAVLCFAAMLAAIYAGGVVAMYRPVLQRGLYAFAPKHLPTGPHIPELWTYNLFEAEGHENRTVPWSDFGPEWTDWKRRNAQWAIFGSAMVFAIRHFTWPGVIPLFLLGLILGWLAYRTQSLVPSITLHSLFNLVAFLVLWGGVHSGTNGNDNTAAAKSPSGPGNAIVAPATCWPR